MVYGGNRVTELMLDLQELSDFETRLKVPKNYELATVAIVSARCVPEVNFCLAYEGDRCSAST